MRALIQRVSHASVTVEGERVGEIEKGLLVLLGVGPQDSMTSGFAFARSSKNAPTAFSFFPKLPSSVTISAFSERAANSSA